MEKTHYYVIPKIYEGLLTVLQANWLQSSPTAYTIITGYFTKIEVSETFETTYTEVKLQDNSFIPSVYFGVDDISETLFRYDLEYFILESFPSFLANIPLPLDVLEFQSAKQLLEWQNQ